ncbi:hypothetical protein [Devosia sp. MC1541]|uniref:hypothetical protein n=1 Tax=Devosia sp. MC1541 TaxID=2725264 RepID=UPI00145F8390|nr:hypothetical protein [Devosia sp. MC1541]
MVNEVIDAASPVLVYPDASEALWLDFYQGVIGSLAGPLVVILAIWLFHKQILAKLPDLDGLKLAGAEMSFKNRVEAVVDQAKDIETPDRQVAKENNQRLTQLVDMAAASPTGAIIAAWKDLEAASDALLTRASVLMKMDFDQDISDAKRSNMLRSKLSMSRNLARWGLLPSTEAETYEGLRKLRNRAMHEPEGAVSVDEARSYVRVADKLTDLIKTISRNLDEGQ